MIKLFIPVQSLNVYDLMLPSVFSSGIFISPVKSEPSKALGPTEKSGFLEYFKEPLNFESLKAPSLTFVNESGRIKSPVKLELQNA